MNFKRCVISLFFLLDFQWQVFSRLILQKVKKQ